MRRRQAARQDPAGLQRFPRLPSNEGQIPQIAGRHSGLSSPICDF
jgi:hypothetical protein